MPTARVHKGADPSCGGMPEASVTGPSADGQKKPSSIRAAGRRRGRARGAGSDVAEPEASRPGMAKSSVANPDRRNHIAKLLDQLFGEFGRLHPALWERRVYHVIVGLVYERLAKDDPELPTAELVRLSKALAEARRTEAAVSAGNDAGHDDPHGPANAGPARPQLARVVRELYGASLPAEVGGTPAPAMDGLRVREGGADGNRTGATS